MKLREEESKRAFVLSDNTNCLENFITATRKIGNTAFEYFCSIGRKHDFAKEIPNINIHEVDIERECDVFLRKYSLGFSCHSKQIFPRKLVSKMRCINIHPGYLPFNRGWYPHVFSIINKFPAGVTIHEMNEKIDGGPIIVRKKVEVLSSDTSETLYNRIIQAEMDLLERWICDIIENNYRSYYPIEKGSYNSKLDFDNLCRINANRAIRIDEAVDLFRALSHPPFWNLFIEKNDKKEFLRIEIKKE